MQAVMTPDLRHARYLTLQALSSALLQGPVPCLLQLLVLAPPPELRATAVTPRKERGNARSLRKNMTATQLVPAVVLTSLASAFLPRHIVQCACAVITVVCDPFGVSVSSANPQLGVGAPGSGCTYRRTSRAAAVRELLCCPDCRRSSSRQFPSFCLRCWTVPSSTSPPSCATPRHAAAPAAATSSLSPHATCHLQSWVRRLLIAASP